MLYSVLKIILYPIVRLLWLGEVSGKENIPNKGSFIIAANHNSYLDFFLLPVVIPRRVYFLAGEVFFQKKLWIPLVKLTGQIKVDRNSKNKSDVYKQVNDLFANGGVLGIFPEGTRSRSGKMQKAYSGVAKFSYKYNIPVIPIGITGTYDAMSPHMKLPRAKKCIIKIGVPILIKGEDYEKETANIMKRIARLSGQSYEF